MENRIVPNSIDIDKMKDVGEIPFTSTVTQAGAMTYTIPIEVYSGVNGMQPQLAFSYNHFSGNGLLGVGWNISGLSSISRTTKNVYYDNDAQGIKLDKTDAFVLDGMRLIKLSETTDLRINYESEQGNIKATAFLSGNVIKFFEVYYPTGRCGIYGYINNSTKKLQYPLTSLSDLYGNKVTYTYIEENNRYLPNTITYANASVEFEYDSRADNIFHYNAGSKVTEDKLLKSITCKYGNTTLRTYSLSYNLQRNSSVISKLDYSAKGRTINPLRFFYGTYETMIQTVIDRNNTNLPIGHINTNPDNTIVRIGKFDCFQNDDALIVYPNKEPYGTNGYNAYSGTENVHVYTGINRSTAYGDSYLKTGQGFIDAFCTDIDGDYRDEIVKVNNYHVSGDCENLTFNVYSTDENNNLVIKRSHIFNDILLSSHYDGQKFIRPKFYYTGDFNGDGKMEILQVFGHYDAVQSSTCHLYDLDTGTRLYEGYAFPFHRNSMSNSNTDKIYIMDYDGDGKSEICVVNENGTSIYKFIVSGSTYSLQQVHNTYTGLKRSNLTNRQLLLGEFNGDGKPDFLLSPSASNTSDYIWTIFYNESDGQFKTTTSHSINNDKGKRFFLQDINNNGLTDLIEDRGDYLLIYPITNNAIPIDAMTMSVDGNDRNYIKFTPNSILIPVDINNPNYFGKLLTLKDKAITKYFFWRDDIKATLLTGVASSHGIMQKIHYQSLDDQNTTRMNNAGVPVYAKNNISSSNYPNVSYRGYLYVPGLIEQYFNGLKNESVSYLYYDAVMHKQGLGFRGFSKITTIDNMRNRSTVREFEPLRFGIAKSEDSPTTTNTYNYTVNVESDKRVRTRLNTLISKNKTKNITVTTSYGLYDTYGNPGTITINYGDGTTESISNSYYNRISDYGYLLGFQTNMTKTTNRNGQTYTEQVYVSSHNNKGLPFERKTYANGTGDANRILHETFSYNSHGLCTSKSTKSYTSSNTITTTYQYDSYGRLISKTNPLGHSLSYTYDVCGRLSLITDHKERMIHYGYNSFLSGTITNVDGTTEKKSYTWDAAGTNGLYIVTTEATGKLTTKTYYDALSRETRSSIIQFDGTESHTDKLYDSYGRLQKISLPFTGSSASNWNTYNYYSDNSDRIQSVAEASGRTTSYSYNGTDVTETKDGIATTRKYDNSGHLKEVNDPGGTITYNLRPDGQPSSITAPGSVITSFEYDSYARKWKIHDPSAGTQTFEYDDAGRLYKETGANNKTITYSYDVYNRLTQLIRPEL